MEHLASLIVLEPFGDVAIQESHLIAAATFLMLLIVVPVIVLTLLFAWRYRQSNKAAEYRPDWDHSRKIEAVIWGAPLVIILVLGTLTYITTHELDPYRPLARIDATHAVAPGTRPLVVDVVSLDWKWLFVYPELGIATVNELAAPVDRPIEFHLTSSSVMNAFYVPALAGMVYTMPGMETQLHAVINDAGSYEGFSANFSGAGFSDMHFRFFGMQPADFDAWVARNRQTGAVLDGGRYMQLERPSKSDPVQHFGAVEKGLFDAIVRRESHGDMDM
jgi:cytochrome o ubiquinol oxidase subunit 2